MMICALSSALYNVYGKNIGRRRSVIPCETEYLFLVLSDSISCI